MAREDLRFPYMVWAHESSSRSRWCLSQSGMPMADPALFGAPAPVELGHPAGLQAELERRLGELFGVDPGRVIVTPGASGAMHLAAGRWFRPGARVAVEVPSYEALRGLVRLWGAELVPLVRRLARGWDADPAEAGARLSGARPGHVFVTNLHNPTGALLGPERVRGLAGAARAAGGVLVSCEVYMEYAPNEKRVHAFALAPNAVSIGSLTKAYGLGALRIGWLILGEGLAQERAQLVDVAYLTWVDPPTPSLRAALAALGRLPELLLPLRRVEAESRPLWERWLAATPGIEAVVPELGIIAFPRVAGVGDTLALAEYLAREHEVDVVPGEFFAQPGHLRVGCGVPAATLAEGLARLARGIEAFRAR